MFLNKDAPHAAEVNHSLKPHSQFNIQTKPFQINAGLGHSFKYGKLSTDKVKNFKIIPSFVSESN